MTTIYQVIDFHDKVYATFCMREDAIDYIKTNNLPCTVRELSFDRDGHKRGKKDESKRL